MAETDEQGESLEEAIYMNEAEEFVQTEDSAELVEAAISDVEPMNEDQMNEMIEQLCLSKAEEFQLIGYDHVNGQDVWECVSDKYHKKGTPPLYQVVNDILSLKVTQFMNYITLNMYRGDQRK